MLHLHRSLSKNSVSTSILWGAVAASFSWPLVTFVYRYFVRSRKNLRRDYGGTYAIITGSSSGIGFEIAKQLASEGINCVLTGRDLSRLTSAAKTLEELYKVQTKVVSMDAASSEPNFEPLIRLCQSLPCVSILVNNVGVHNDVPANVSEMLPGDAQRIITVNCLFQTEIISRLVPFLKPQPGREQVPSLIVNVGSLTSHMHMPMLSVYAATKAYLEHFSACLGAELEPEGIEVMCLRPGITTGAMSGISTPSLFCPTPTVMADACVRMVGRRGLLTCAPYWPHAILDVVNSWVPHILVWSAVRDMHTAKRNELLLAQHKKK